MKTSTAKSFFDRKVDPATERFVDKSLNNSLQVKESLNDLGWTQKDFAKKNR